MRSRRGSLEWNLETVGKLIIGIAVLILVIYISMKLVGLFIAKDIAADRALGLLSDRVALVRQGELTAEESSVIVAVPPGYLIAGFPPEGQDGWERIEPDIEGVADVVFEAKPILRPKECGDGGCLCAITFDDHAVIACAKSKDTRIVSTIGDVELSRSTRTGSTEDFSFEIPPYADGTYPVILGGPAANVRISVINGVVVLDPRQTTVPKPASSGG